MGHLNSTNLPERGARGSELAPEAREPKSRLWLWVVVLAILVVLGIWYFRGTKASTEAQSPNMAGASGGAGKGGRQGQAGPGQIPVVVATAQKGDLPLYFNGLGTVTAFNTVTVRSRVDGQIVKINFTEG